MKLIDKLAKEFVAKQHGALRKTYKIPGYEQGFRDGFEKALDVVSEKEPYAVSAVNDIKEQEVT